MKKKNKVSEAPKNHSEFAKWFVEEYSRQIYAKASRHLILNRYAAEDIKHYMVERILEILSKRESEGNPIEEPKIYFRKLIPFWCVEYQRMNGFVFGLPKRPRSVEAEKIICSYGFTYLKVEDSQDGFSNSSHINKLSYVDINTVQSPEYFADYSQKGVEADVASESWNTLMSALREEDAEIIEYLFRYNLTVPQAAKELNIAVSTAYQRKSRALYTLSGLIVSKSGDMSTSWRILDSL